MCMENNQQQSRARLTPSVAQQSSESSDSPDEDFSERAFRFTILDFLGICELES